MVTTLLEPQFSGPKPHYPGTSAQVLYTHSVLGSVPSNLHTLARSVLTAALDGDPREKHKGPVTCQSPSCSSALNRTQPVPTAVWQ